jgi:hypothetical protein
LGIVVALSALGCAGGERSRVLLGPLWVRECRTGDGEGTLRQTRQVGPLVELGEQSTVGAGYLERWTLAPREPADDPEAGAGDDGTDVCEWRFRLFERRGRTADEIFVSRTEVGVLSGVGRDLTGINVGFNHTNAIHMPDDAWIIVEAFPGDPRRSKLVVHRVPAADAETREEEPR